MGKFITIVLVIYVVYYLLMILFDLFIKKNNTKRGGDDGETFDVDGFQTQDVGMTEEELAIEEKLQKDEAVFDDEDDQDDTGGVPQDEQEESILFGQVETQGFTIDEMNQLFQESKRDGVGFMERLDAVSAERSSNSL